VEHTTGPAAGGLAQGAQTLPPLRYEGFEPSPYAEEELLDDAVVNVRDCSLLQNTNLAHTRIFLG
jgi:hypothetical protein